MDSIRIIFEAVSNGDLNCLTVRHCGIHSVDLSLPTDSNLLFFLSFV